MWIKILTPLKRAFNAIPEKVSVRMGFIFVIFKSYYGPAVGKKAVHSYHDYFPKRLNEPLQGTEFYDKTSNEQKGY